MRSHLGVRSLIAAILIVLWVVPVGAQSQPGLSQSLLPIEGGSGTVDVAGVAIYYDWLRPIDRSADRGAIILVHGLGGSGRMWFNNVLQLAEAGYRVYTPDLPGFGNSALPEATVSVLDYDSYLAGFLDAIGEEKTILVGSSMGGYVTWDFAAKYQDRVTALVLADAAGLPIKEPLTPGLARLKPLLTSYRRVTWIHPGVAWFLDRDGHEKLLRRLARPFVEMGYADPAKITPEVFESSFESICNARILIAGQLDFEVAPSDYREILREIQAPTLIIWGREDGVIPVEDAQEYAEYIPSAQLVILDGVGHVPMQEAPDEFNSTLAAFLSTLPVSDGVSSPQSVN